MLFFGPVEEDMRRGVRNRLMRWAGLAVPYRPGKRGIVVATFRAQAVLTSGRALAIAGEGRIHVGEGVVLPVQPGAAYLALRAGVPVVPLVINGTGWLAFRRVVRLRVGRSIDGNARAQLHPARAEVGTLAEEISIALRSLATDFPDQPQPGPIGRWLTELFNVWPEGSRPVVPPARPSSQVEP
jgi:1-acyl-sn-glycerol-3-phosphate acyltransferase